MIITFNAQTQPVERVEHAMEILFADKIRKYCCANGRYIFVVDTDLEEQIVEEKISLFYYCDIITFDDKLYPDYTPSWT